ncbi:double-strand break repair protein MRE11-like isoform X2 [Dreissena polymorpha]|nr:double-strand break repair protein MRE11-like isoform X2 [Dreissena polymorpha]XP_052264919.1 double-strand break repair protein MRE11-like isoform X2 [Dreissena polymorpha]XP_052264920.1 double-strand break repair protein MRE11-like isoform X2 [Dreissena polymorpha]
MADQEEDILKILIATDNHLGYAEKDPVRGNDSLVAFEEILENARKHEVDFVLLGGDLFHENKPSRRIIHGTMALFRNYCLGDKPVQFEVLSDQSKNFEHCQFPGLNYEDPNLNIAIPVFSIHGNHDDPTGQGNLCSLDLLHTAGYVNYFGKTNSLDKIQVSPLLFQKGSTKLALYGLGSVRDERLHRIFLHKNVTMLRPKENKDEWFNMFVIHQNRSKHGPTNHIPEQFLDDFLDLVLWGHEHECRIEAEWNSVQNFYVTQPGSSVATSLSEGETAPKYCGLLQIKGKDFKIEKIRLETVRQFYMEDIVLKDTTLDPLDHDIGKKVESYCQKRVEALLEKAAQEHTGNKKQPRQPLIRIRVDYSGGFEPFSQHRFGQKFVDRVANPKDMIYFSRKKAMAAKKEGDGVDVELDEIQVDRQDTARVEDMVKEYFSKADEKLKLQVLSEKGIGMAVKEFVDKEERDAIPDLVTHQLKKTQDHLKKRSTNEDVIDEEVHRFKEERQRSKEEDTEVKAILEQSAKKPHDEKSDHSDIELNGDDSDESSTSKASSARGRGRGSRGGPGSRGGRGSRGGKGEGSGGGQGSRGGRGGRGKAAVVEESQKSIMDSFSAGRPKTARAAQKSYLISDSESEKDIIELNSSDDDPFGDNASSKKKPAATKTMGKTGNKRGGPMQYDSDSDEDKQVRKRRR